MKDLFDAFWRAAAYCVHPRIVLFSLLPLAVAGALVLGLGWFYWEPAVAGVRTALERWALVASFLEWLDSVGAGSFRAVLAPLIVVALAVPVILVLSLLLVAWLMAPSIVDLVARRRFETLQRKHGAGWFAAALWSFFWTLCALLLLLASLPLWLIPPLVLVLPPLIWGWLTAKVMAYDVLADHASRDERRRLLVEHRWPLLAIGLITGYLGAAPSLLWAASAVTLIFAPILIVVSVWLYTLIFAFSALWFAHYALAALQQLRQADAVDAAVPQPGPPAALAGSEAPAALPPP
jgi:hypothetical protein